MTTQAAGEGNQPGRHPSPAFPLTEKAARDHTLTAITYITCNRTATSVWQPNPQTPFCSHCGQRLIAKNGQPSCQ